MAKRRTPSPRSPAQIRALKKAQAASAAARKNLEGHKATSSFPGADKMGRASAMHRIGEKRASNARYIRQYTSNAEPGKDARDVGKQLRNQYTRFLKGPGVARLRALNTRSGRSHD